jgi:hypothetical protein
VPDTSFWYAGSGSTTLKPPPPPTTYDVAAVAYDAPVVVAIACHR